MFRRRLRYRLADNLPRPSQHKARCKGLPDDASSGTAPVASEEYPAFNKALATYVFLLILLAGPAQSTQADAGVDIGSSNRPLYFPPPASAFLTLSSLPRTQLRRKGSQEKSGTFGANIWMKSNDDARSKATAEQPNRRKKKKNKYANFSKADKLEKDPFEAMVSESETKIRAIEIETARRKNKQVPLDEEDMRAKREVKRERNKLLFPDTREIDPYDPTTYGYTELGTVMGAHGVHGLMKVMAVTEFPERLCERGIRHMKAPNRRSPREVKLVEGRHRLGDEYLVKLEGVGDRDAANKLRGSILYARQTERPRDIGDDEYLITELVGLDVFLEEGYGDEDNGASIVEDEIDGRDDSESPLKSLGRKFVGTVGGILLAEDMCSVPGLGQDMIEVILPRGRTESPSWRDEMVLLPFVPQIVPTVDLDERAIYISPPVGLLDLTYVKEEKVRIKGFLPPAKDETEDGLSPAQ